MEGGGGLWVVRGANARRQTNVPCDGCMNKKNIEIEAYLPDIPFFGKRYLQCTPFLGVQLSRIHQRQKHTKKENGPKMIITVHKLHLFGDGVLESKCYRIKAMLPIKTNGNRVNPFWPLNEVMFRSLSSTI